MANPAYKELEVKSLQELKAFRKPPPVVQLVMECVLLLEPMPTGGATGWRAALKMLTNPRTFMSALRDYPTGQPRVPAESLARCRELLSTVDAVAVKKVSIAAVGLYHWAQYVVDSASSIAVAPRAAPTSPQRVGPPRDGSPRVVPSKPTQYVSSRPQQFAPPARVSGSRVPVQAPAPAYPGYPGQYPVTGQPQPRSAQVPGAQPGPYAPMSQPPPQMPAFPGAPGMPMRPGLPAPAPFPQQPLGFGGASPFAAHASLGVPGGFGMPGAFHPGF